MNEPSPQDQALLNDLLDGRLKPEVATALRTRISHEAPLAEAWRELQQLRDWGRDYADVTASVEPPEVLAERIRVAIQTETASAVSAGDTSIADTSIADTSIADTSAGGASSGQARRRGRLLRMLAVSYAAAALLVVGITVSWVLVGSGDATAPGDATIDTAGADKNAPENAAPDTDQDMRRFEEARDEDDAVRTARGRSKAKGLAWEKEDVKDVRTLEAQDDDAPAGGAVAKDEFLTEAERDRDAALARLREAEGRPQAGGRKIGHFGPADSVSPGLRKPRDAEAGSPFPGRSPQGRTSQGSSRQGKAKDGGPPAPKSGAGTLGEKRPGEAASGVDDAAGSAAAGRGRRAAKPPAGSPGLGGSKPGALQGGSSASGRPSPGSPSPGSPSPRGAPEREPIGIGGGLAAKPLKAGPLKEDSPAGAKEGERKSAPETPVHRLRLRLAAAREAREKLFVLEVEDAQAGLKMARGLLDQGPAAGSGPDPSPAPATDKRALGIRFYRADTLDLRAENGTIPRTRNGRPSKKGDGVGADEAARAAVPQYVGSVGRHLDLAAFQRLVQRARASAGGPTEAPVPQPSGPAAPTSPSAPTSAAAPASGDPTPVRILVLVRR